MVKQIRTVFEAIFKAAEAAGIFFLGYSSLRPYFKYLGQISIDIRKSNLLGTTYCQAEVSYETVPAPDRPGPERQLEDYEVRLER